MDKMMRLKAMDGMMKDKPSIPMRRREPEMEEGMISMPVTPEEKEMILAARETNKEQPEAAVMDESEEY